MRCPDCTDGQRRVYDPKAPTQLPELAPCRTCKGTGQLADATALPDPAAPPDPPQA
jgi:hypothetical protein